MMNRRFLTVAEFAAMFRRNPATVRTWCHRDLLEHRRIGRDLLIPAAEATRVQREGLAAAAGERGGRVD